MQPRDGAPPPRGSQRRAALNRHRHEWSEPGVACVRIRMQGRLLGALRSTTMSNKRLLGEH